MSTVNSIPGAGAAGTTAPAPGSSAPSASSAAPVTTTPAAADPNASKGAEGSPAASAPATEPNPAAKARAISAALAEKKKRIEVERQLEVTRAALVQEQAKAKDVAGKLERFKTDPLGALDAVGMTYEEITKAAIARHGKDTPAARVEAIEAKLKADDAARVKAAADASTQQQQEQTRAKVVAYVESIHTHAMGDKAAYEILTAQNPDYAKGLIFDVADEVSRRTGKVPSAKEVCDMIENYFVEEGVQLAGRAKVKARLTPAAPAPAVDAKPGAVAVENPAVKTALEGAKRGPPRTLTNKLAAAPVEAAPKTNGKLTPQEAMREAMKVFKEIRAKEDAAG